MCYKLLDSDLLCQELMLARGRRDEKHLLLLHSSKACGPMLLIQSARPSSLWLLSLGSAAHGTFVPPPKLRVALQPYNRVHTVPAGTHPGSRPTVHGIFGGALTDLSGYEYVSSRSGSFHCVYAVCFSAEVFHGISLPQITSF